MADSMRSKHNAMQAYARPAMGGAHIQAHNVYMNDQQKLALGIALAKARKHARLTQPKVSELTGIDQGGLSRIENGIQPVGTEQLSVLASLYGRSVSSIWAEAESVAPASPVPVRVRAAKKSVATELDIGSIRFALVSLVTSALPAKSAARRTFLEALDKAPDELRYEDGLLSALAEAVGGKVQVSPVAK